MWPWLPDVRPGTDAAGASYSEPLAVRQGTQAIEAVASGQWPVASGH